MPKDKSTRSTVLTALRSKHLLQTSSQKAKRGWPLRSLWKSLCAQLHKLLHRPGQQHRTCAQHSKRFPMSARVLVPILLLSACSTSSSRLASPAQAATCPPPTVIRERAFRQPLPACVYELNMTQLQEGTPYGEVFAGTGEVIASRDRCLLLVQKWAELEKQPEAQAGT